MDKKQEEKAKKIVGLPLSEDYREAGIEFDPSQISPKEEEKAAEEKGE